MAAVNSVSITMIPSFYMLISGILYANRCLKRRVLQDLGGM